MNEQLNYNLPIYQSRVFSGIPGWEQLTGYGDSVYFPADHIVAEPGDDLTAPHG